MSLFFKLLDPDPQKMNAVHSPASSTPQTNANCILHQVSPSTHKSAIAHITGQSQHTQDQSCLTAGTVSKQISPLTKQVGPLSNNRSTPSQTAIMVEKNGLTLGCSWWSSGSSSSSKFDGVCSNPLEHYLTPWLMVMEETHFQFRSLYSTDSIACTDLQR